MFAFADQAYNGTVKTLWHGFLSLFMGQAWFPGHAEVWNAPTWFLSALNLSQGTSKDSQDEKLIALDHRLFFSGCLKFRSDSLCLAYYITDEETLSSPAAGIIDFHFSTFKSRILLRFECVVDNGRHAFPTEPPEYFILEHHQIPPFLCSTWGLNASWPNLKLNVRLACSVRCLFFPTGFDRRWRCPPSNDWWTRS